MIALGPVINLGTVLEVFRERLVTEGGLTQMPWMRETYPIFFIFWKGFPNRLCVLSVCGLESQGF